MDSFFSEENLELMEDLNVIDLIVDAIKMHKKVCWSLKSDSMKTFHNKELVLKYCSAAMSKGIPLLSFHYCPV